MRHIDTTDPVGEEEVNVNGTIYMLTIPHTYEKPPENEEEAYIQYIREQYKALLEKYPGLEVTLLDTDTKSFQDFCIEPKDDVELDMAPVITWWRKNR